jgi:hypothetical protein
MYLLTCTRFNLVYSISDLWQFITASAKSNRMATKYVLRYTKGTKDLKLSSPHSDASEIPLEGYCDSDAGNFLNTRQSMSSICCCFDNSTIYWCSKKHKSVATSIYEAKYMALTLSIKQWIWSTNTVKELNVPVTHATMFYDLKATIDIAYKYNIHDRSKHIYIAYHLVHENIQSRQISHFQVGSAENLADICPTLFCK